MTDMGTGETSEPCAGPGFMSMYIPNVALDALFIFFIKEQIFLRGVPA